MRNLNIHKKHLLALLLLPVILIAGCAPIFFAGAAGTGVANSAGSSVPLSQQYTDLNIRSQIYTILNNTKGLNGANVEVTVFNGIVLLLGQVPTEAIKQEIASKSAVLDGVTIVYNQMSIGPNEAFTQFTGDSWTTSKVITNLTGAKGVNPLHFKVVTQDGVVYLMGQVTAAEGDAATKAAAATSSVKQVVQIFNTIPPAADTAVKEVPGSAATNSNTSNASGASSAEAKAASAPQTSAPASAASTNAVDSTGIPEYAPDYGAVENGNVGPAASD